MLGLTIILALSLAPVASADHGTFGLHWPTTTVAVNGGGCSGPVQCRWLRIIDRTGFGPSWRNNALIPALIMIQDASGGRFQFTISVQPRIDVSGGSTGIPVAHATPLGAIRIVRHVGQVGGPGVDTITCDNPSYPETYYVEPYCNGDGSHVTKAVLQLRQDGTATRVLVAHELGHGILLLGDTYNLPGCGQGGPGIMCHGEQFNAHDRDVVSTVHGHAP